MYTYEPLLPCQGVGCVSGLVLNFCATSDTSDLRALFQAADKDHNGVLDLDEFVELVSTSKRLAQHFVQILEAARERRERVEYDRLSRIFRTVPAEASPSGRRVRPSLSDLRALKEVSLPWDRLSEKWDVQGTSSPHKSQLIQKPRRSPELLALRTKSALSPALSPEGAQLFESIFSPEGQAIRKPVFTSPFVDTSPNAANP